MFQKLAIAAITMLLMSTSSIANAQGLAPQTFALEPFDQAGDAPRVQLQRQTPQFAPDDDPDLAAALQSGEAKEASPEQAKALATVKQLLGEAGVNRQPAEVLRALLEQRRNPNNKLTLPPPAPMPKPNMPPTPEAPKPEGPMPEAEEKEASPPSPLSMRVMTGNWSEIKAFLGTLPPELAPEVYDGMLTILAADTSGMVLPQELVSLTTAAPGPLSDKDLALLGKIVARSQHQAAKPTEFLAAIQKGTPQLGGNDPATRVAAVKLLLAANLVDEAAPYLPPLDAALKDKDVAAINLHARFLFQRFRVKQEMPQLLQAWELTQTAMRLQLTPELTAICIHRSLAMAPLVPRELASKWFQKVFQADPAAGLALLTEVTGQVARMFAAGNSERREQALRVQQLAGDELLALHGENLGEWSLALEMLTRGWINEAQKTAGRPFRKIKHERDDRVEALPIPPLLATAPSAAWLQAIGRDTADHVRHLLGNFAAKSGDQKNTLAIITELVPRDPDLAKQLAEELVTAVSGGSEHSDYDDMRWRIAHLSPQQRSYYLRQLRSRNRNQPREVTRAGQLRRLNQLAVLLNLLQEKGIPSLDEDVVVEAFASCHSPAEVYLTADIETIFGPLADIPPASALKLAETMRMGLAQGWRDPDQQRQQGTKRTPQEQALELTRGYALAIGMLQQAAPRAPDRADLLALRGGLHFDQAEFLYGQQVDLQTYAKERDAAFADFAQAAVTYNRSLEKLPADEYSIEIFRRWFQASLGTSDFAFLTRQDEPDKTQVEKLAQALGSLQQGAAKHQEMFAQSIRESLDEVPAVLKPHLVRQALVVVGNHPAAAPLQQRLTVYDELLKEVELRLTLDGSDQIGVGKPFGVFVSLAGTRSVLRENDAFSSLLISTSALAMSRGLPADPENDARQRLENELREKLSAAFEIDAFTFHPPQTKPRATGREGWEALPVAYLVLRVKDAATDRLPATQFDLEFSDGDGQVRLPVQSQLVLLDARAGQPPVRPAREVKVKQLLDDRELAKGRLRLEIVATAKGVVPELDQLLQAPTEIAGFVTKTHAEQSLSVSSLETGEHIDALIERRWLLELEPKAESPHDDFTFPKSADKAYAVTLQRYDDADIVDAKATTSLRWPVTHAARRWLPYALGGGALLLVVAIAAFVIRSRAPAQLTVEAYSRPPQITPFSVLGLLRRIHADGKLRLTPTERQSLGATIARLEGEYFRRGEATAKAELEPIVDQWMQVARAG